MTHYIINTGIDYADEFDYPVISLMTAEERQKYIDTYNIWSQDWNPEIYFGTNEALEITHSDVLDLITHATPVSSTEYDIIAPYLSSIPAVDITDDIFYILED